MPGCPLALCGLRRCCQSQRRRVASAASAPCVRRYSVSTPRRSSGRNRSMSDMKTHEPGARSAPEETLRLDCTAIDSAGVGRRAGRDHARTRGAGRDAERIAGRRRRAVLRLVAIVVIQRRPAGRTSGCPVDSRRAAAARPAGVSRAASDRRATARRHRDRPAPAAPVAAASGAAFVGRELVGRM